MLWSGFLLGLISSFHCVGMCGPLAIAVPVQHLPVYQQRLAILQYHIGRILTYSLLGLLFGILGRHIFIAGLQQHVSIILGISIIVIMLQQQFLPSLTHLHFAKPFTNVLHDGIRYFWGNHSAASSLMLGMLNGLLPCGMVYFAVAGALACDAIANGVLYMAIFGVGTFPLMLAVHYAGSAYLTLSLRKKVKQLVPVFVSLMGVLLILRGLNLGIPYLSPLIGNAQHGSTISCH